MIIVRLFSPEPVGRL